MSPFLVPYRRAQSGGFYISVICIVYEDVKDVSGSDKTKQEMDTGSLMCQMFLRFYFWE